MHTVMNRDIWGHIVKYFRVSFSDDSAKDVKINRSTLRSIALVCSELTTVAVSELWRSVKTLEPIVYAFNAPPFRVSSPAFEYKRDSSSDYWEIVRASNYLTKGVKLRVLDYLSHVRYLHFPASPSSKERALWQALQAFRWINPLCPNLRGITFTGGSYYPSMTYHLVPFLVPSMRSIRFDSASTSSDEAAVSTLLGLIQHRDVQIFDIVYAGYISRRIVKHIFQFPYLRSAKILITPESTGFLGDSDVKSFLPPLFLTSLDIDLGMFRSTLNAGTWIESLPVLSMLSLQGSASAVIECLQNRNFAPVHSLSLFLRLPYPAPDMAPNIFPIISAAFPSLHSLCLENKEKRSITETAVTLSQIYALRGRPMRCLVICGLRLSLSLSNVIDLMNTWPTLRHLSLAPDPRAGFERYHAYKLLSYFSRHAPHVTDLNVPLNMSSLITTQPLTPTTTICPLQRLELTQVQNLPSRLEEKFMLAQNLITLFPRLNVVTAGTDIRELQFFVKSLQGALSLPPRRGDNLY